MTDDIRPVHEHVVSLVDASSASAIIDLSCGDGEHLRMLARQAPPHARLVGVDVSEKAIDAARAAAGDDARFTFVVHDLTAGLPFQDAEFDRVLSVDVVEAIPDKDALLREAHRVLRPGGRLVLAHFDWDSALYDGEDKALVRRVVHAFADWKQKWMADADGWMGRRLWRTVQRTGLFTGRVDAFTHTSTTYAPGHYGWDRAQDARALGRRGLITPEECERFLRTQDGLAARGEYFYAIAMFSYVGAPR